MSGSEDDLSLIGDDLEIIENAEQNHEAQEANANQAEGNENQEPNESQEGAAADEDKKEVKVKRVRNPQPKLNVERLKGPRGLQTLQKVFEDVKFQGRGHEEEDLSVLMKNYEYWCHRLFPKFPFDDCLERMEKLGTKKPMQAYIKRIRMDMVLDDEIVAEQQDEVVDDNGEATRRDDFDALLPQRTQTQSQPISSGSAGLTEEQLKRIQLNRETAQRVRQQMLIRNKAHAESSTQICNQSSQVNTENNSSNALSNDFTENMSVDASQDSIAGESFRFQTAAIVHDSKARRELAVPQRIASQEMMSVEYASPNLLDDMSVGSASQEIMSVSPNTLKDTSIVSQTITSQEGMSVEYASPILLDDTSTAGQESSVGDVNNHLNSFNNLDSQELVENMSVDNPSQDSDKITAVMVEEMDNLSSISSANETTV